LFQPEYHSRPPAGEAPPLPARAPEPAPGWQESPRSQARERPQAPTRRAPSARWPARPRAAPPQMTRMTRIAALEAPLLTRGVLYPELPATVKQQPHGTP
jgi:hypothetical protein